tara:strand:- start:287 stop:571 length:285 start_codon:yes stop_codon:yes gene_type:complete
MTFAQYLKIETSLGGIGCTDKQFIQACLDYILPQAKHHNIYRKARHSFIRDGLTYLDRSRADAFGSIHKSKMDLPPCEGELKQAWHLNEISKWS